MSGQLHIASLIVHHLGDCAALDTAIASLPGVELALREGGRSVLLCETAHESELMQRIDAMYAVRGVLGISLVHHHAEAMATLMENIDDDHTP